MLFLLLFVVGAAADDVVVIVIVVILFVVPTVYFLFSKSMYGLMSSFEYLSYNDKIVDTSVPLPISVRTPLPRRQSQAHRDLCINRNFSLCICWKSLSLVWFEYFPFLLQAAAVPCLCGCHAGVRPTSCVRHISGSCLDNWHPRPVLEILPRRNCEKSLCICSATTAVSARTVPPPLFHVQWMCSIYWACILFTEYLQILPRLYYSVFTESVVSLLHL